jgi:hypothetical protein
MANTQQTNNQVSNKLENKHQNTIDHLKKLQDLEKYMFRNLQNLDKTKSSSNSQQQMIKLRIDELSSMRKNLFTKLKNMYSDSQQDAADSRSDYADQLTVVSVIEDELKNSKNKLKSLKSDRANKIRMSEIGDWEFDRYESHKNIFKTIVYGCLIVLLFVFLMSFNWFPASVGTLGIILSVAYVIISIASTLYWNLIRDDRYYQKFDQGDTSVFNDPENPYTGAGTTGSWKDNDVVSKLFSCKNASALATELNDVSNKVSAKVSTQSGFRNMVVPYETTDVTSLYSVH